ncbi:nucleotide sugar dehydrogenase [Rhizobium wuzhouense]|uniref:UDP-glucose 6-dehydrogenase n=1 Tax=Rhizobium wuzhouense TaxID=1986026 RepID=A0ABX5NXI7_9HYPH|nr:nucleotide sugar dehydrogenase [Rhizobium wuzhouense]PYB77912.1 UDP-glucose 6-dehydrogenase [Rhizobium wuzhouense]
MKITVVGTGYVGFSLAILLARHHTVIALDVSGERVDSINRRRSPIADDDITMLLQDASIALRATLNAHEAFAEADFIIVATPTDYDLSSNAFDTSSVDSVVASALHWNKCATVVIKSTIPIGHTRKLSELHRTDRIIFSPEFLREGKSLYDNLYPSRIVVGSKSAAAVSFANLLKACALVPEVPVYFTGPDEAEAVKLFANSYLAMRVAFFNELDNFAIVNQLSSAEMIRAVGADPRIGMSYNNPSFGYGGYCLPKDTRQLMASYGELPQALISATIKSNEVRCAILVDDIARRSPGVIGVFRTIMKSGSDNHRSSAVFNVIEGLRAKGMQMLIYEPTVTSSTLCGVSVEVDIERFKNICDLIICNRMDPLLEDVASKVYSRDVFGEN